MLDESTVWADGGDEAPRPVERAPSPERAEPPGSSSSPRRTSTADTAPPSAGPSQTSPAAQPSPRRAEPVRLRDLTDVDPILIIDAQKTSEGASTPYIAYVIRSQHGDARRRYSEFEALRVVLGKLYPVLIIPPIPPHHSLGDYAAKQSKAKEDAQVIARRRRMLAMFLNRLNRHPILSRERVFARFLDPGTPWAEIIHAPPVTHLPKNPLRAPAQNPTDTSLGHLYNVLPLPSTGQTLQDPDQRFLESEAFTAKFSAQLSGSTEKVNKRLMRRWTELGADHADFGALLNGFGLTENQPDLAHAIERTGQAIDATYVNTNAMVQEWERTFTEPLAEYSQFSAIIKQLLKYRHQKHLQYETIRDVLETKRVQLEELERTELEAQRLHSALDRSASARQSQASEDPSASATSDAADDISSTAPPGARKSGAASFGLLGAIQHSIHNMIDVDPEATRRSNISKTRESIGQLDEGQRLAAGDLRYASQTIQADLDRFQRQKVADFREMLLSFGRIHREWCRKNIEAWEEAKREIGKIDAEAPGVTESS